MNLKRGMGSVYVHFWKETADPKRKILEDDDDMNICGHWET